MAKSASPGTALQTRAPQEVIPADMLDTLDADSGMGVSFKQEDQLLPLIYILQSNSPAVDKRGEAYIEGAEAGHFWMRNSITPIADGEEGIDVIPCEMVRSWIEWLPNRQGFVARHDAPPADTMEKMVKDDSGREKAVLVRQNGNIIQDTREFFLLCNGRPFVLPCTGTKHTFARQWQTMFHQFTNPKTGSILPAFAHKYKLTTVPMSNAIGKWFGIKFQDLGLIDFATEYEPAKAFYKAVKAGEKRAEAPISGMASTEDKDDIPF
jgi:hypothetical protein